MSEHDAATTGAGRQWDLSFLDPGAERARPTVVAASDLERSGLERAVTGMPAAGSAPAGPSHGLNVPVCQDVSFEMGHDAGTLAEIIEAVDFSVRRVRDEWHGPDAESWQAKWTSQRRRIMEASEGLVTMRRRLDLDIEEQQRTSRS